MRGNESNDSIGAGIGSIIPGLLGVAFVVLKLCGVIDWSWWWVTLPFWGPVAIALIIIVVSLAIFAGGNR